MKITIDRLEAPVIIGVREHERRVPQTLLVDIEFSVDPPSADRIDTVVDYSAVVELVLRHLREGRFHLIETAAATTARRIGEAFALADVWVRITKPAASSAARAVSAEHRLEKRGQS